MSPTVVIKRKSNAKRVRLSIKDQHTVTLTVPRFCSNKMIQRFLHDHQHWIDSAIDTIQSCDIHPPSRANDTQQLTYLGRNYPLRVSTHTTTRIRVHSDHIAVELKEGASLHKAVEAWFISQAKDIISDRVLHYQEQLPTQPSHVGFRQARTRWGSCSSSGRLSFNWTLLCAPLDVIDGVVVHELCHLVHMNHSPAFWALVHSLYPQYDQVKQWTTTHKHVLLL